MAKFWPKPFDMTIDKPHHHILLLGGTADGRAIAAHLAELIKASNEISISAIVSFAGVTSSPPDMGLPQRIGGFGGIDGLAEYIRQENVTLVIDATHPYASQMSKHAGEACARAGVKCLTLWRPKWQAEAQDDWHDFPDWQGLIASIPEGAKVFLAAGQDGLNAFAASPRCAVDFGLWARALARPKSLSQNIHFIESLPAKTADEEIALFKEYGITHVACKNSGGNSSRAKLIAARKMGLPVLMVDRPDQPPPPLCDDANAIITALEEIVFEKIVSD